MCVWAGTNIMDKNITYLGLTGGFTSLTKFKAKLYVSNKAARTCIRAHNVHITPTLNSRQQEVLVPIKLASPISQTTCMLL